MRGMCAHLGFLFQVSDFRPETADVVWAAQLLGRKMLSELKKSQTLKIRQRLEKKAVNPEQNFELETSFGILGGFDVFRELRVCGHASGSVRLY